MSIHVIFGRPRGEPTQVGPFRRLVFHGAQLLGDEATRVAVHEEHSWRVGEQRYSRLDIPGPLVLELSRSDRSRTFGPFTTFSCVDGVAYVQGRVFAFVDNEQGDWYCVDDGHHWRLLEARESP